jgi:UDPglucose 6-dehydrogenase
MNVGVVGLGMVGNAIKDGFEYLKHKVLEHDIKLNTQLSDIIDTDIVFICVSTPPQEDGSCDVSIVETIITDLSKLKYNGVICIKSTVEPGTTRRLINTHPTLTITHVPEFLREAHAYFDFTSGHNVLVVGTDSQEAYDVIVKTHGEFPKNSVMMKPQEAELVKYYSNVYKATRITFANSFARVCNHLDVDYTKVKDTFLLHGVTESEYLNVTDSFGAFGGSCLPKDVTAFNNLIQKHNIDVNLFTTIIGENEKYK